MASKSKSSSGTRVSGPKTKSFRGGRNAKTGELLTVRSGSKTSARGQNDTVSRRKSDVIQIRASAETKAVLVRAASVRGQGLSEFMLDSARREAEGAILDQRLFFLNSDDHAAFLDILDRPPQPSADIRKRMKRKPSWMAE